MISVSIVSHGQGGFLARLLSDIARFETALDAEILVTLNTFEPVPAADSGIVAPMRTITNTSPKGFAANHNAAFRRAQGEWFCVMNPDIRLPENPFPRLLEDIERLRGGVIAPAVVSPNGMMEDSVRRFPTPLSLVRKALEREDGRYRFAMGDETFPADWVAGMFMLFRAEDYRRIGGFDERFFLYYEDVDICARLWKAGCRVLACPSVRVIHDAQRASRRDLRYMRWHAASMARYLGKHWLRPMRRGE